MIAITGAAGFIGSCLLSYLNQQGVTHIILVDDFSQPDKNKNIEGKKYIATIHRNQFIQWLAEHPHDIAKMYHLGARTDTTLSDPDVFEQLNLQYSKAIWKHCAENQVPLVYASSAATYGSGENGFEDNHEVVRQLKPLNLYAHSKNEFDKWALAQRQQPPQWYGIKFFNVYGPNEYHKGRMASVVFHAYKQIRETGVVRLFRSHRKEYRDGEQLRDFIYVKDVVQVLDYLMEHELPSGLYNLGTGKARSFVDLAHAVFHALGQLPNIVYVDMPFDIRNSYQYFTQAAMNKLRHNGYQEAFYTLEEGVNDYVKNYLLSEAYY